MKIIQLIEKYNYGIIGALGIHMILFIWLNIENMSFTIIDPPTKTIAVLDYSDDLLDFESLEKKMKGQSDNSLADEIMNVTSNQELKETKYSNQNPIDRKKAEQEAIDNIKNFEAEQMKIASADNPSLKSAEDNEVQSNPNLFKENEENEVASYGANIVATASFYVPERDALHKKIPSYKCKNEGLVRVNIKVTRNGKVVSFEIDESNTNTNNACLRQQALEYASKWRFSQNFNDELKKQGWIEFNYLAQ